MIGNINTITQNYNGAWGGKIKNARIYNRILSATEVITLYNAGVPDETLVTNGLVFQGLMVQTSRLAEYVDHDLTDGMNIIDNVHWVVGSPHGTPTGRNP